MLGFNWIAYYAFKAAMDIKAEQSARERYTPERFAEWLKFREKERDRANLEATAERRHREIVSAIESAGRRY